MVTSYATFEPRSIAVGFEAGGYYALLGAMERAAFADHGVPEGSPGQKNSRASRKRGGPGSHWSDRIKRDGRTRRSLQGATAPIDRCLHCEPACYDHVAEHGLQSRGGFLIAPLLPRVSQLPGQGMTYDKNPTPALVRYATASAASTRGVQGMHSGAFALHDA